MLSASQLAHARAMVAVVQGRGLPQKAAVIVVATALVESNLTIYANRNVSDSLRIPHEAVGQDHASVGVLQQQVPSWGTAAQCMDPASAAQRFLYGAGNNPGLLTLPPYRMKYVGHPSATSWQSLPIGAACQAVQVSAFPDRYQARAAEAVAIVSKLWNEDTMTDADRAQLARIERKLDVLLSLYVDEGYHRTVPSILERHLHNKRYAATR